MYAVCPNVVVAAMASKADSPVLCRHSKTAATKTEIGTDSELRIRSLLISYRIDDA